MPTDEDYKVSQKDFSKAATEIMGVKRNILADQLFELNKEYSAKIQKLKYEPVLEGEIIEPETDLSKLPVIYSAKAKVYYSPDGFVCGECFQLLISEPVRDESVKVFCANLLCSENMIDKIIKLPEVNYEVSQIQN